jgi:hypothetical protein
MRRPLAIATGLTAMLLATPVLAFQQSPEAPPPEANSAAPAAKPPTPALDGPAMVGEPGQAPAGVKVFGFGILPKLDFGLELLYGDKQQQELQLQQGALPDDSDDIILLGKIKRHF